MLKDHATDEASDEETDEASWIDTNLYVDTAREFDQISSERNWFAEGIIEDIDPLVVLAAPEKFGKSWMLADLIVSTIAGIKWLGEFEIKRSDDVILFDSECGARESARRIARIARARDLNPRAVLKYVRYIRHARLLDELEDVDWRELQRDFRQSKPALIIVDPLRGHMSGSEDSTRDMVAMVQALNKLGRLANCPVVVAHHLNKSGGIGGNRSLLTGADVIISGSDTGRPVFTTTGRRLRAGDPVASRSFSIDIEHTDDEDDAIATTSVTLVFGGGTRKQGQTKSKLTKPAQRLLEALGAAPNGLSVSALRKQLVMNYPSVTEALTQLEDAGLVSQRGKLWSLSTAKVLGSLPPDSDG